jgi:metal-responsive CopG/Arc/MetJ family transcriptional regulator
MDPLMNGKGKRIDMGTSEYYLSSMKVKTSITLSRELLAELERHAVENRSEFIEKALWAFIAQAGKAEQTARDVRIINEKADSLNEEAADVLAYQVKL